MPRLYLLPLCVLASMAFACSGQGSFSGSTDTTTTSDASDNDAPDSDVTENDAVDDTEEDTVTQLGEINDPCTSDAECVSQFCISAGDSNVCSTFCASDEDCPEEWACKTLVNSGQDAVRLCVPARDSLCGTCENNTDCGQFGDMCVTLSEQSVCAVDCSVTRECPTNFSCVPAFDVAGNEGLQCMPDSGVCSCPEVGENRPCLRANTFGICDGVEICNGEGGWSVCSADAPNAEVCDGIDNDCDNLIDEGLDSRPCSSTPNEIGSCEGTETCTGPGGWVCDARVASVEMCDQLDNDCNGEIDDGLCYDGNPCTRDLCDPTNDSCNFVEFQGPCEDGSSCTTNDLCVGGTCTGTPVNCDDGNTCTTDACNPSSGCANTAQTGAPCQTGNQCTSDLCQAGVCTTGVPVTCNSNDTCSTSTCDPAIGCVATNLTGNPCDDDSRCTVEDVCSNGQCIGGREYCEGQPCSNCSGTWSIGGLCQEFIGVSCICICG